MCFFYKGKHSYIPCYAKTLCKQLGKQIDVKSLMSSKKIKRGKQLGTNTVIQTFPLFIRVIAVFI